MVRSKARRAAIYLRVSTDAQTTENQRHQLEASGCGLGCQLGQFGLLLFLLEFSGPLIHPGLTVGEQAIDQNGQVTGHRFYRRHLDLAPIP